MNKIKEIFNALKSFFLKYKKEIIIPTAIMVAISFTVILALSLTNKLTSQKIKNLEEENQRSSMHKVLAADTYKKSTLDYKGKKVVYHIAKEKNKVLGYIFITEENGYGGTVSVMTAIKPNGKIKAVYILDVADETPGLGKRAAEKEFYSQFSGLEGKVSLIKAEPDKKNNEVKALTGATITSTAVTRAVNRALDYSENLPIKNDGKGEKLK